VPVEANLFKTSFFFNVVFLMEKRQFDTYKSLMRNVQWFGNKLRSPEERIIARAKEQRRILKNGPKRFWSTAKSVYSKSRSGGDGIKPLAGRQAEITQLVKKSKVYIRTIIKGSCIYSPKPINGHYASISELQLVPVKRENVVRAYNEADGWLTLKGG